MITEPGRVEVQDMALPRPGPGEVRVRVEASGVCGTDLHLLHGAFGARLPLVPGHEVVGLVDEIGPGVLDLREGERVVLDPVISCGACHHCRRGWRHHCLRYEAVGVTRAGGFADYVLAPAANLYPAGDLAPEVAVFAEPLGCVAWGMRRLEPALGGTAVLFGAGAVGLLLMQGLLAAGVSRVTVVDPIEERLALARSLGAARTVLAGPEAATTLRDLEPYGFDVAAEATGVPAVVAGLPDLATAGGKVLVFGVPPEEASVAWRPHLLFRNDLTVVGSFSLLGTIGTALEWLQSGRVRVDGLVTHRLPLDGLGAALEYKAHPSLAGAQKVLIEPAGAA